MGASTGLLDSLTQVGEEAGIEPPPETRTRSSQERGQWAEGAERPWGAPWASELREKRCSGPRSLLPGRRAARPPLLFVGMLPRLTGLQCPISVFPLLPGADSQRRGSCQNNFLLEQKFQKKRLFLHTGAQPCPPAIVQPAVWVDWHVVTKRAETGN